MHSPALIQVCNRKLHRRRKPVTDISSVSLSNEFLNNFLTKFGNQIFFYVKNKLP